MATRCNIHFCYKNGTVAANIYRHWDGYPDGVLPDLETFFNDVEVQCNRDTRFDDPSYLAAKGLVRGKGRHCRMEGCTGRSYPVRWSDGKLSWCCTKGLVQTPAGWQIG